MGSDFLKFAIDSLTTLVELLDKLISNVGVLPTLLGGFALFKGGKNLLETGDIFGNIIKNKKLNSKLDDVVDEAGSALDLLMELQDFGNKKSKGGILNDLLGGTKIGVNMASIASDITNVGKAISGASGIAGKASAGFKGLWGVLAGHPILATIGAITAFGSALLWLSNRQKEIKQHAEEVVTTYEKQKSSLDKTRSTIDAVGSEYQRLSKGVGQFGENVGLTTEEYQRYQEITNQLAENMPSLVKGYDTQGNAILSVKGNLEELNKAYADMRKEANQKLIDDSKDVFSAFNRDSDNLRNKKYNKEALEELMSTDDIDKVVNDWQDAYYDALDDIDMSEPANAYGVKNLAKGTVNNLTEILKEAGLKQNSSESNAGFVSRMMKENKVAVQSIVNGYNQEIENATKGVRSVMGAMIENSILDDEYKNITDEVEYVLASVSNKIDASFFEQFDSGEAGIKQMQDVVRTLMHDLNAIDYNGGEIGVYFDAKAKVDSGEITLGEYKDTISDVQGILNGFDDNTKKMVNVALGLDDDGNIDKYNEVIESLEKSNINFQGITPEEFVNGLTMPELQVAYDLVYSGTFDTTGIDVESFRKEIEQLAKVEEAMTFTIDIDGESAGIESLNNALAESRSAIGLTSESIDNLESRYSGLKGYDPATLFQETANGISLNTQELNKMESALANSKLEETSENINVLKDRYDTLGERIRNCTDEQERATLVSEREDIRGKIVELAELATMYEGLTSSYNEWQNAESAGNNRDLYSNVYSAMEGVKKELDQGWIDDGTKEYFQLIWGEDKWDGAGKSIQDYRNQWNTLDDTIQGTSYSIQDFFKVDKDGNLTSQGIFNFFDAVKQKQEELGKDWIQSDENGNMKSFNFGVNGDKAIADALGISEELVQIFLRASQDAGFVVNFDGTYTQLADMQNEAKEAMNSFNEIFDKNYSFNFDTNSLTEAKEDLEEAKKLLDNEDFWNHDAEGKRTTFNFEAKGAEEAMQMVSTLQAMVDRLNNKYINITVKDDQFKKPLEMAQGYERTVDELNQLELNPKANTSEIEEAKAKINDVVDYFANLDDGMKKELNIPVDLEGEDLNKKIKEMLDSGTLKIPTELDIQSNIDESLEDLKDLALLNSDILDEEQEQEIKVRLKADFETEVNESDIDKALKNAGITDEKEIEVATKFITDSNNSGEFTEEELEVVVKYTKDLSDIDSYTPEQKEAVCKFIIDNKEVMAYTPEEKAAIAKYIADPQDVNSYTPEEKTAITRFLAEHGSVDSWTPENKQAIAQFLLDNALVEGYQPSPKDQQVISELDSSEVDSYQPPSKTMTIWATIKKTASDLWGKLTGGGSVDGTAHVDGTAFANGTVKPGKAYKQGSWGTKGSGIALGGEVAPELLVRDGKWHLIGEKGAEFFGYKRNDIIFNGEQTKQIFEKGKITHGNGRGRALVSGTAFSNGTIGANPWGNSSVPNYNYNVSTGSSKSTKSSKSASSDAKEEAKEFEEVIDWIELAIDRIERAIKNLDTVAGSTFRSWTERTVALNDQIKQVGNEIDLQQRAYNRYMQAANEVGLSAEWVNKVQNGKVDLELIKDEALKEKIDQYQEWFEKSLDCRDAIIELREEESELYQQRFDNVSAQYDGILGVVEHKKNMLEEYMNQSEAQGWLVSEKYYDALIKNEEENIAELQAQKDAMLAEMHNAVESGKIEKYSESW